MSICLNDDSFEMKMSTEKHHNTLQIINFDAFVGGGSVTKRVRHSVLLPDHIRALVVGPSNCGKTNAVFTLLFAENGLKYENVYVFSKSLYQPKYKFLEKLLTSVPEIGYFPYSENDEVLKPNEAIQNSIMIFDDVSTQNQNRIRDYFSMGRHSDIDSFYCTQTYSSIPKQLVRDNANLLLIFRQDERNLKHIYCEHVTTDMSFNKFKELCRNAWIKRHDFLVINKDCDLLKGRYRVGFDNFIQVV